MKKVYMTTSIQLSNPIDKQIRIGKIPEHKISASESSWIPYKEQPLFIFFAKLPSNASQIPAKINIIKAYVISLLKHALIPTITKNISKKVIILHLYYIFVTNIDKKTILL